MAAAQLRSRGRDPRAFDLAALARATAGFSGAEIESVIVSGLYAAYSANQPLTTDVLLREAAETVPLSVLRAEDIAAAANLGPGSGGSGVAQRDTGSLAKRDFGLTKQCAEQQAEREEHRHK